MTTTHPAHAAPDNSSTHDEHHHDNLLVKYGAPKVMAALFVGVLLLQMGFILSYVAAFHQPTPRDIEIAVIADQGTPDGMDQQIADKLNAIDGSPLDLTYMEYELLTFLASHPGKVFTRETLLSRVWGYEYYGGARTVDVHVRRLRAKLGEEHAGLISTVRSVGYRFGQSRWGS